MHVFKSIIFWIYCKIINLEVWYENRMIRICWKRTGVSNVLKIQQNPTEAARVVVEKEQLQRLFLVYFTAYLWWNPDVLTWIPHTPQLASAMLDFTLPSSSVRNATPVLIITSHKEVEQKQEQNYKSGRKQAAKFPVTSKSEIRAR